MTNNFFKIFSWKWLVGELLSYFLLILSLLGNQDMSDLLLPSLKNWRYLIFTLIGLLLAFSWRFIKLSLLKNVNIDTNRTKLDANLENIIRNTKKRLWTVSLAGRKFIELNDRNKLFQDLIDSEVDLKIVVCDPESTFVKYREQSEDGYSSNRIRDRIMGTLTGFRTLINQLGNDANEKVKIRVHSQGDLNNSILVSDDNIYVLQYLYKTNGKNCPVLNINEFKQPELFEIFKTQFSNIWKDGKLPTESMYHELREEPLFGQKTEIKCIALYAAFDNDGKLLLIKRKKQPRKGYYSFIGGHSFMDELLFDAMKREVREEIKCETYSENLEIIRAIGKDNASLSDDFFFDEKNFNQEVIKGIKIIKENRVPNELASSEHEVTKYNLFRGLLNGEPQLSNEVEEIRCEKIDDWINLIENRTIKIQPIDYLLLKVLRNAY
jgi:hypothetical protein